MTNIYAVKISDRVQSCDKELGGLSLQERRSKAPSRGILGIMMDREVEQGTFMSEDKQAERSRWPVQAQECSMCGDVGFADQLHQCTRCRVRYQHSYCCNSKEGLRTGTWICDWCRLVKKEKTKDVKETQPASVMCSVLSEESGGLECLLKAALNEAQHEAGVQTSSADGGSLCSSSIESVKEDERRFGVLESPSCSSEDRISQGEETMSAFPSALRRSSACDTKRNPKLTRSSGMKNSQKRRQKSLLEQQCGSVQLKRLSSFKNSKTGIACDPPKSFVRRYKSLSDISF